MKPALFHDGRIINGTDAAIDEVPYQVSLQTRSRHFCGASIISNRWIVTAAHCCEYPMKTLSVRAGSTLHYRGGSVHRIEKMIKHENFGYSRFGAPVNDICVMRVDSPFVFDETRQPISLFAMGEPSVPGVMGTVTGWGSTDPNAKKIPDVLQLVQVPIISKEDCSKKYASFGGLADGGICAAYPEGGKDSCQGDSGGPLAIDGRLAGVVSWGYGCAVAGNPGVYSEIAAYRAWIEEQTTI